MKQKFTKRKFTIGGDPEFVLRNIKRGHIVQAKDYRFFNKVGADFKIGRDGNSYPVEIRPSATYIDKLPVMIRDINNIIETIGVYCEPHNLTILCGAYPYGISIGGHIHLGGRDILDHRDNLPRREQIKIRGNIEDLVHVLDFYLTPLMNKFMPIKEVAKRATGAYGRMHEYRHQHWGIEYRTPYSFLASPLHTRGFYALTCLLAHHYKKITLNNGDMELISKYAVDMYHDRDISKDDNLIYKKVKPKILKMMSLYSPNPEYNGDILSLFNLVEQKRKFPSNDVLFNYGLKKPEKKPTISLHQYNEPLYKVKEFIHKAFKTQDFTLLLEKLSYYPESAKMIALHKDIKIKAFKDIKTKYLGYTNSAFMIHIGLNIGLIGAIINSSVYRKWFFSIIKKIRDIKNV